MQDLSKHEDLIKVTAYLAEKCGLFKPLNEGVLALVTENTDQKELIDSLGNQLATEKLSRIQNEAALESLGKELATFKLNSMKGVM